MIGIFRREQLLVAAVEMHAVEMLVVGIAVWLLAHADKADGARFLVDVEHLGYIAGTMRDLIFELAGGQVVEVEIAPVVALAEPENLIRVGQRMPIHFSVAALIKLGRRLAHHFAHFAGRGVGDAEPLLLVIARGGHESQVRIIRAPLNIGPARAAAGDVVAQGRAMLIGRHFQPHQFARGHIDDDALDHGDVLVAHQRILPGLQRWVAIGDRHEIHLAGFALVLLECGDLGGVRRPQQDGGVGVLPAGVVGGVAVVLDAIGGELSLRAGGQVAHPKIPVADKRAQLLVGRRINRWTFFCAIRCLRWARLIPR